MAEIGLEVIIGSLTFTGSLIAAGKLQEILPQRPITYRGQNYVSLSVLGAALALMVTLVVHPEFTHAFLAMIGVALVFGMMLVTPIGGADMPTVISLLNSYAGLLRRAAGLRAQQQGAGRGWRAGRGFRLHPVGEHVQGHEPLVHQRAFRRLRANPDQRCRRGRSNAR